jgi:ectoine hydroxylase-related dioxygenase (phytanoyl-CoA dioxygenase family)
VQTAALDIDSPYTLTDGQIAFYRENGFVKLKNVLSPDVIEHYGRVISQKVKDLNTQHLPIEQRDTYGKAFLQIMNIWTKDDTVKEFVMGRRLARIAAELMGARGARLYHDQALYKEPGGGVTPWHADQYYWPLASDKTITAWIPLQATPLEMGPLAFCPKSQNFSYGRDIEIGDESEMKLSDALKKFGMEESAFELGEVSFHSGWTFHRAGANKSARPREVMTIIYMDIDMRLAQPKNKHQINDWNTWCPGAKVGEVVATPINPVIYERGA